MKMNFIKTTDPETAEKLRNEGLQEIESNESNSFVFLNCNVFKFSEDIDKTKINYSNVLCL